jgi:hypothetical protein
VAQFGAVVGLVSLPSRSRFPCHAAVLFANALVVLSLQNAQPFQVWPRPDDASRTALSEVATSGERAAAILRNNRDLIGSGATVTLTGRDGEDRILVDELAAAVNPALRASLASTFPIIASTGMVLFPSQHGLIAHASRAPFPQFPHEAPGTLPVHFGSGDAFRPERLAALFHSLWKQISAKQRAKPLATSTCSELFRKASQQYIAKFSDSPAPDSAAALHQGLLKAYSAVSTGTITADALTADAVVFFPPECRPPTATPLVTRSLSLDAAREAAWAADAFPARSVLPLAGFAAPAVPILCSEPVLGVAELAPGLFLAASCAGRGFVVA